MFLNIQQSFHVSFVLRGPLETPDLLVLLVLLGLALTCLPSLVWGRLRRLILSGT